MSESNFTIYEIMVGGFIAGKNSRRAVANKNGGGGKIEVTYFIMLHYIFATESVLINIFPSIKIRKHTLLYHNFFYKTHT